MLPLGGTSANLKVDPKITESLAKANSGVRGVRILVDPKSESLSLDGELPLTPSIENDFAALKGFCEEGKPCLVLFMQRLEPAPPRWVLIAWTPEGSPVKVRMLQASSHKTVKGLLDGGSVCTEYPCSEHDELTWAQFTESTRERTEQERHAAMTIEEQTAEEVKKEIAKERQAAPVKLAGMATIKAKVSEDFEKAVQDFLALDHPRSNAVIAKIKDGTEEIVGEQLTDAAAPSQLKGKLPEADPCYILMSGDEKRLFLLSWIPPLSSAKKKMKCSTLKGSLLAAIQGLVGDLKVVQAEVFDEDDLTDDVRSDSLKKDEEKGAGGGGYGGPPGGMPMPGMGKGAGGYGGPPGGFKLPGMGPPPGAVKMPGMTND